MARKKPVNNDRIKHKYRIYLYNVSKTNMATPFDTPLGFVGGKESIKG